MRSQILIAAIVGTAATACTQVGPTGPTPREMAELARELSGRIAGPPQRCIDGFRTTGRSQVIGPNILYEEGRTLWVNHTSGGCESAGRAGYILVTEQRGTSEYCRGDIVKVVTTNGGMFAGSCGFGDFVPYRKPR